MRVELREEGMEIHGGAGVSYNFFTKSGTTLRCDVKKGVHYRVSGQKCKKKLIMQNTPK